MDWLDVQALEAGNTAAPPPRGGGASLLEGLNEPQREAVTHGEGPLLILAGPGSGKTRVITRRIAWLVAEGLARPSGILAITFTNKAAREMRERVAALLPMEGAWISTFHAMGARILRREIELLGGGWTRDFTIYDTHDRNQLLRRLVSESGYDSTRFKPALVGGWISARKNRAAEPDRAGEQEGMEAEVLGKLARTYEEALAKANALDFDDLLLKLLELFETQPGVRDAWSSRFQWVLVDEYQDTNRVQYELARHLSGWHRNLAVCGDPDQSIYAWRGADIRNILDFERDFGAPRVVKLEQNYRSTRSILEAAQAVIARNRGRKDKRTFSAGEAGELLCVLECGNEDDEAREIVHQVQALRARGTRLSGIALFYRANFMQRALESALRRASVPYRIVAGVEFYERREIRDLLAWLKLAVNPADDVAFLRVVNVPARGIGEKSLAELARFAADRRLPLARALGSRELLASIRGRARAGLEAFGAFLERISALAERPAAVAVDAVLAEIDRAAWLADMDDESLVDREANLEELRAHAEQWDHAPEVPGVPRNLRGFLQELALVSETDGEGEDAERVTLMTLHAAKGLEFEAVFVAGCEEELLPHARALSEARGDDPDAGLEEERRLFYVGMTRAKRRLFLSWSRERMHFGSLAIRRPSRFLEEIPRALVEGALGEGAGEDPFGAPAPATASAAPGLAVGDRVEHAHFGRGVVVLLQGMGVNARATVRFATSGERQLLLAYAKLGLIGKAGA